jgi:4-diphosphocytidyl-2-C-methyl-D-erythritol kinase
VAAGLGGGSSDAAAAFDGAIAAWDTEVEPERRLRAAASIGSDVPFFLAGGPALVEGRGERVTPLTGLHGHPGILLVTPSVTLRTPDVFAVFDGARGSGDGSVRMTSAHLAQELGNGLSATDLMARAGVLAAANDLLSAAILVEPRLVGVRRALTRVLGRPIGLTGSGPTLWTLYPSLGEAESALAVVEAAFGDGTIPTIGDVPPSIIATTIRSGHEEPLT